MKPISELFPRSLEDTFKVVSTYKDERDEMIKKAVIHINLLRKGTSFENKVETPAKLAKRINRNIFLGKHENNGELALVLKDCERKGSYSYLYYITK